MVLWYQPQDFVILWLQIMVVVPALKLLRVRHTSWFPASGILCPCPFVTLWNVHRTPLGDLGHRVRVRGDFLGGQDCPHFSPQVKRTEVTGGWGSGRVG